MHRLPKHVVSSKKETLKWEILLKMGKPFPKRFMMCSRHFKPLDLLAPINRLPGKVKKTRLSGKAFPCLNLPVVTFEKEEKKRATLNSNKPWETTESDLSDRSDLLSEPSDENSEQICNQDSVYQEDNLEEDAVCDCFCHANKIEARTIGTQAKLEPLQHNLFETLLDGDNFKLASMTGIPSFAILDQIVVAINLILPVDNCLMSVKNRVILTMLRLKIGLNNTQTSIMFQINEKTGKKYFVETVEVLAEVLKGFIFWQTREQNSKNLPRCFWDFANTMTVLDCTEIKTATFSCLTCRTCLYSHYKGCHTIKVLIGVAPSGLINFISQATSGRASDKAVLNSTSLLSNLEKGDGIMVDKGFMIADELLRAGIEMIRPSFMVQKMSKEEVVRNTKIAAARVHVERRIARIKLFKILSEKVHISILPYIDDILTIICGLSNLSSPILSDEKFR